MLLPRPLALAINRLPLALVQVIVGKVFDKTLQQHPDLFDRLGAEAGKRFCFAPTDLDLVFLIHPASKSIRAFRKIRAPCGDGAVAAPMLTLLALLEGRIDGDAVFFSRSLSVTGDMEAMLALRNALDDCSFDLPSDLAGLAGPFAGPFRQLAELVRRRALNGLV
ncbi:ubiquinone anaerobic biosynthesis accessory factor UbiT [Martelella soudanensis]|uniref:ubiquinone anaerobic biosynthesis accessory factor UbiT n=1 Tax=unclassified Martelella TaxID=2629616 RepID=UPI0015E02E1E|nr:MULTISPECIES: SCP2 sterol-binding domain-containing protein [unclassified Martelella]